MEGEGGEKGKREGERGTGRRGEGKEGKGRYSVPCPLQKPKAVRGSNRIKVDDEAISIQSFCSPEKRRLSQCNG